MNESTAPATGADILDVLVVGGGPAGTAAAFRATELGLSTVVLDYDDLMKRIRDYSKEKLILPSFGGGDRMCFPRGGELIDSLRFAPIDKDEMCLRFKDLYRQHGLDTRIGVELTGLERRDDGVWRAICWDHTGRSDVDFLAHHVVLGLGRGVPRRFDVPGDTEGVAFRLDDPKRFVGSPACVVGGGTSAAEAVIGISNAKAQSEDPTAVYWSYRGSGMPRVSKALAEVFFEAYVGNGNIRYYPHSEPTAVVVGSDRRSYLAVRVDRRSMDGRPAETTHLEFPKEAVVACIGEDIPERLLGDCGVELATGGPRGRRRMVVNRWLETVQPNLYLVGDLLSQAYFETDDFTADPAGFREVKHRGNIKSALRDGVLVAGVIAQKLAGKSAAEIDVEVEDADEVEGGAALSLGTRAGDEDAPPAASLAADRRPASRPSSDPEAAVLIRLLPGGVEEEEHPLVPGSVTTLGRSGCDLSFPQDSLLGDCDASISYTADGCFLRDDGSAAGVFLRAPVARKIEVEAGDVLQAGRQFLLVAQDSDGAWALHHFDPSGQEVGRYPIPADRTVLMGRQAPDVTLDPDDRTLSRRQLAVSVDDGKLSIKDLKSVNGTFLRVQSARRLEHGQQFRLGRQRFLFSERADLPLDRGVEAPSPSAVFPAPAAAAAAPVAGGPSVTFVGIGTFPVAAGQTLCDVAEANGVALNAECHAGICGSDPLRIRQGAEHLAAPPDDQEVETLEDICELEPGPCRLACKATVTGPVEVEIL